MSITRPEKHCPDLKNIYYNLDDKIDIFKEIINEDIGDNYICHSMLGEYGHSIRICDIRNTCIYNIFVSIPMGDITTFYNEIMQKGIYEKIYSNRTEFFIDNVYHSNEFSDEIMNIVKTNTKMVMHDKKFPNLYEFIMSILESNKDDITLVPKNEFFAILY
jgi:hypothetical protein